MEQAVGGEVGGSQGADSVGGKDGGGWGGEKDSGWSDTGGFDRAVDTAMDSAKPDAAPPDGSLFEGGAPKDAGEGHGTISGHGPPATGGLNALLGGPGTFHGSISGPGMPWDGWSAPAEAPPTPARAVDPALSDTFALAAGALFGPSTIAGARPDWDPDALVLARAGMEDLPPALRPAPAPEPPPARPGPRLPWLTRLVPWGMAIVLLDRVFPTETQELVQRQEVMTSPALGEDIRLLRREGSPAWEVQQFRNGRWETVGEAEDAPDGTVRLRRVEELERLVGRRLTESLFRLDEERVRINDEEGVCHPRGLWVEETANMRPEDRAYQDRVTRHPGSAYAVVLPDVPDGRRGHVLFDDCITETRTLVDAKNRDAAFLRIAHENRLQDALDLADQARRQRDAAGTDWRIEWHVPDEATRAALQDLLDDLAEFAQIVVVITP
jgi:hypothetical protein